MTVDAPAMPDVGVTTDTTATGAELSPSSTLSDFEATGAYAERVGGGDPDVVTGLQSAASPDRRHFVLEMERRPVSNRTSASPGEIPGTEFERHLGNPDREVSLGRSFQGEAMTVRKLTILGSVALLFSGTAWAQDEQARKILPHELGGPFLVFRDKVQAELKLSDDQKQRIRETLPDYAPETMKTFAKLKDMEPEERQREMEPLRRRSRERFAAFLKATLRTEQLTRLKQLELQHEGPGVLGRPEIRKDLKITDEQWTQIMGVIQELQRKLQTLILEAQTKGNPREVLPRAIKLRNDYGIKVEAVLSDAQRKQWREMLGKSVDVFTD